MRLRAGIQFEHTGGLATGVAPMSTIASPVMADTLSSRESEVATLVTAGWSNKQIAHHLNVSEGTVRNHLYHIFRKVGVTNRTALAGIIFRHPHLAALVKRFEERG